MLPWIVDGLSWALILIGSAFTLAGGIGVLRLPDVYTRMHAASLTDTLGAGALLLGLMLQAGLTLVMVKLLLILIFLFFTSPTSSFSLAHAALSSGVEPRLDPGAPRLRALDPGSPDPGSPNSGALDRRTLAPERPADTAGKQDEETQP